MSSYSEIIRVWPDPNDSEQQICVSAFPDSQEAIDIVNNFNPELEPQDLIDALDNARIESRGVWERPKQRPRN